METGSFKMMSYVSTAFVSGDRPGIICEDELECGQRFENSYEKTKFESEMLVRRLYDEIPIAVFRPSIIVGDSRTGVTSSFNVLYVPLRLIQSGLIKYLPGYASTRLDVVPVDYVCEALTAVTFGSPDIAGKTFHLVVGKDNSPTAGEIVRLAKGFFDETTAHERFSEVTFLPENEFQKAKGFCTARERAILNALDEYAPYLCVQRSFDDADTRLALTASGLKPPAFKDYYRNLLRYCLETDWGKRHRLAA
jgi:thioester reductase-like protein